MSSQPKLGPNHRRKSVRQRSFLRGVICFNDRRSVSDCLIRDFSDEGARLVFSSLVSTPEVIELYIPQKEQTLSARVTWRNGEEFGVVFIRLPPKEHLVEAADLARRVTRLEAKVADLKRALGKLRNDADLQIEVD